MSNPPFFGSGTTPSRDRSRRAARFQEAGLPLGDLVACGAAHLDGDDASLWVLLPPTEQARFAAMAQNLGEGLAPVRRAAVRGHPGKPPHLVAACYRRRRPGLLHRPPADDDDELLTVWRDRSATPGEYDASFVRYLEPYYLIF